LKFSGDFSIIRYGGSSPSDTLSTFISIRLKEMVKIKNWGQEENESSSSMELYSGPSPSSFVVEDRRCRKSMSAGSVNQGNPSEKLDVVSITVWAHRAKLAIIGGTPPRWA